MPTGWEHLALAWADAEGRGVWVFVDRRGVLHAALACRRCRRIVALVTEEVEDWEGE